MSVRPTSIGVVSRTNVYKVPLSQFGLSNISQIAIEDDLIPSGGTGGKSGLDLDFIKISSVDTNDPALATTLFDEGAFVFSKDTTNLDRGFIRPLGPTDPAVWDTPTLTGVDANGTVIFDVATLGTRDAAESFNQGSVSLGEGGRLTVNLPNPVSPQKGGDLFLYFGDEGDPDDSFVFADESPVFVPRPGISLGGTEEDDTIRLGEGPNLGVGDGDDDIQGLDGNDTIAPGLGNDTVDGGSGTDTVDLEVSAVGARLERTPTGWRSFTSQGVDDFSNVEFLQFLEGVVDLRAPSTNSPIFVVRSPEGEFFLGGDAYDGPVDYLQRQLVLSNLDEVVIGTSANDFINTTGGVDAVDARGGNDVIDGGTGSNFLTGGAGVDIFFTDARIPGLVTWSTVTDFDPSLEEVTIWGWKPGVSTGRWVASDGAEGFKGATYHADVDGDGTTDTSITFTGLTQDQIQTPLVFDGLLWFE